MNERANELVSALERAARGSDESAFDAAFDRVLEGARDAATPSAELRALVGTRLFAGLASVDGLGSSTSDDAAAEASTRSDRASGSESAVLHARRGPAGLERGGRGHITGSVGRAVQWSRGVALLTAGVAIGFVWGRAPLWSSDPARERPTRTEAARELDQRAGEDGLRRLEQQAPGASAANERTGSPSGSTDSAPLAPPSATREGSNPATPTSPSRPPPSSAPAALSAPSNAPVAPPRAHALSPRAHSRAAVPPSDSAVSDAVRRAVPTAGSNADALRFALEQLRQAQLFLRGHEPVRALDALDALDARVAPAILQDEREVMRTLALCDAGDEARANALAKRVLERAPDSAYSASLRESCAGRSALLEQMRERTSNPPR
jgi:hypothetical protein